jgi:hypothetical protein
MTFYEYAQLVAAVTGAILGVLALGGRLIYKPLKKSLEVFIDQRLRPIEDTLLELKPNGGSSVADRIVRLEERQSGIGQRLDDVYDLVKAIATKE